MRKHVHPSSRPATFTRAVEALPAEMRAFVKPSRVAHVWARGNTLSSSEATSCLIDGIHAELGDHTVPVFHRMRRGLSR